MHTIPAYMINYIFAVMAGASIVFNLLAMFAAHNFQKNEVNCDWMTFGPILVWIPEEYLNVV